MEERLYQPQRSLESSSTLLRYANPVIVPPPPPSHEIKKTDCNVEQPVVAEEHKELTIRDILDKIFPPKTWIVSGNHWKQSVSGEHIDRADVIRLSKLLESRLEERNAKLKGYCVIRRSIFIDLFDEIIRQETIMCPERGLLLLKIKNEFKLGEATMNAMYENSVLYGMRKALEAKQDLADIENAAYEETQEHDKITKEIRAMEDAVQMSENRYTEIAEHINIKYREKIDFYTNINNAIKAQINAILQPRRYLLPITKMGEKLFSESPPMLVDSQVFTPDQQHMAKD